MKAVVGESCGLAGCPGRWEISDSRSAIETYGEPVLICSRVIEHQKIWDRIYGGKS